MHFVIFVDKQLIHNGFKDDLFLLSPSRQGLQEMLDISEEYVKEHSISFSTDSDASKSKTKGIIFEGQILSPPCRDQKLIKTFKLENVCHFNKNISDGVVFSFKVSPGYRPFSRGLVE